VPSNLLPLLKERTAPHVRCVLLPKQHHRGSSFRPRRRVVPSHRCAAKKHQPVYEQRGELTRFSVRKSSLMGTGVALPHPCSLLSQQKVKKRLEAGGPCFRGRRAKKKKNPWPALLLPPSRNRASSHFPKGRRRPARRAVRNPLPRRFPRMGILKTSISRARPRGRRLRRRKASMPPPEVFQHQKKFVRRALIPRAAGGGSMEDFLCPSRRNRSQRLPKSFFAFHKFPVHPPPTSRRFFLATKPIFQPSADFVRRWSRRLPPLHQRLSACPPEASSPDPAP